MGGEAIVGMKGATSSENQIAIIWFEDVSVLLNKCIFALLIFKCVLKLHYGSGWDRMLMIRCFYMFT